ncbi:uncharacterized protein H6S33_007559 [Morchella sextelata]|uniref:uncharacterized protein n=1 Tax=Morchella sextelata TaxID=1174677 RepID=UPI001D052B34|nr:uncharacterized protein H6S33_007559 [Morchella sextelata]KAH0603900.1 hypothetical protein H6S33_007559 [Morchella sextelata]
MHEDQESSIWCWIHDLPEVQHVHKRSSGRKFYANNMFIHGPVEPPTVDGFSLDIIHQIAERGASDIPLTFSNIQKAFPGSVHEGKDDCSTRGEMAHDEQVLLESHYGYLGRTIIQVPEIVLSLPRENPGVDDLNRIHVSCEEPKVKGTLDAIAEKVADAEPTPSKPPKRRGLFEHTQPVQNITNLLQWSDGRLNITDAIFVWNMLKQARRLERHCGDIPAAVELDFEKDEGYESDIAAQMCHKPFKRNHSDPGDRDLLRVDVLDQKKGSPSSSQNDERPVEIEVSTEECITGGEIKNIPKNYPSLETPEDEIRRLTMTNAAWKLIEWMKGGTTEDVISLNFGPSFVSPTTRRNTIDFHQRLQEQLLGRTQNLFHESGNYIIPSYDIFIGSAHIPDIVPSRGVRKSKDSNKVGLTTPLAHRHAPTAMLTDSSVSHSSASPLRLSHSLPYSPYAKTSFFDQINQSSPFNNHSQEYVPTACKHPQDHQPPYADCHQNSGMENADDSSNNSGQGSWLNLSSEDDDEDGLTQRSAKSRRSPLAREHTILAQELQPQHGSTHYSPALDGLENAILQRSPGIGRSAAAAEQRVKMFSVNRAPAMNTNSSDGSQGASHPGRAGWKKDGVYREFRALEVNSPRNEVKRISDAMRSRIEAIERKQRVVEPPDTVQPFSEDENIREKNPSFPIMEPSPAGKQEMKEERGSLQLVPFSNGMKKWNNDRTSSARTVTVSVDTRLEENSALKNIISKKSLDDGFPVRPLYQKPGYVDRFVGEGTNPQQSVAYFLACKQLAHQTALSSTQESGDSTRIFNGGDEVARGKEISGFSISSVDCDSSLVLGNTPNSSRGRINTSSSSTSFLSEDNARDTVPTRGREQTKDERFMDGRSKAMEVLGYGGDIAIRRTLVDLEYTSVALPVSKRPAYLETKVDAVIVSPYLTVAGYGSISFPSLSTESTDSSSTLGSNLDATTSEDPNYVGVITPPPRASLDSMRTALSYTAQSVTTGYQQQAPMSFTPFPATIITPNPTIFDNCKNIFRKCLGRNRQRSS